MELPVNVAVAGDAEISATEPHSPWPFLDKWVTFKKTIGLNYIFQCLSCLPKLTELKVNKRTKANMKSHFQRLHPDEIGQIDEACRANVVTGGRIRTLSGQSDNGSTSKRQRETPTDVLQSSVDNSIVKFVVANMLPLQVVDSPSFRHMVLNLNPTKDVPSRRTLGRRILEDYEEMKESLIR